MKRAILYARVSHQRQVDKDLSIPSQFEQMRRYCSERNWQIIDEISDEAESGRYVDRDGIQQIMARATQKPPTFDVLLVWKLSRFARNLRDAVNLEFDLKQNGVELVSVSEPTDDTPMGESLRGIMHVVNEMYSLQLSEDIRRGQHENIKRGFWNGRRCSMGYRVKEEFIEGKNRKLLEIDPHYAPTVQRIFALYLDGKSMDQIAGILAAEGLKNNYGSVICSRRVGRILHNESYTGVYTGKDLRLENHHPAIIDRDTFNRVQDLIALKRNYDSPRTLSSRYLLSGLAYCSCGAPLRGITGKSMTYCYYACENRVYKKTGCKNPYSRKEKLEGDVLRAIGEKIASPAEIQRILDIVNAVKQQQFSHINDELKQKEQQHQNLTQRTNHLYEALETGELPLDIIAPRLRNLIKQQENLKIEIADLHQQASNYQTRSYSASDIQAHIKNLHNLLRKDGDLEKQRVFIRSFVERITVGEEILIKYMHPF